jgi:hypothetical protein
MLRSIFSSTSLGRLVCEAVGVPEGIRESRCQNTTNAMKKRCQGESFDRWFLVMTHFSLI